MAKDGCGVDTGAALLLEHAVERDPRANQAETRFALNYLDAFGYLAKELADWKDINMGDIINAISDFEKFFGMKATGQLTPATIRAMEMPRCGHPDMDRPHHAQYMRVKQFV